MHTEGWGWNREDQESRLAYLRRMWKQPYHPEFALFDLTPKAV